MAQEVRRVGARRTASLVLVVLGTVILFVGGIALYAREEVFDADAFAQHASESLSDDRVDNAVANPIVDQAIKVGPDELINARPLLTAATRGVLASQQFRGIKDADMGWAAALDDITDATRDPVARYLEIEKLHEVGEPPPWLQTDKPWDNPEVTGQPVPVTVRIPPLDALAHGAAYFNAVERSPLHGKLLDGLRDYYG
jgi:hypothetical protein